MLRAASAAPSVAREPSGTPLPSSTAAVSDTSPTPTRASGEAGGAQRPHQQRQHLGVGARAAVPQQLDARLALLRRRRPAGGGRAERAGEVRHADRSGVVGHPGGHEAGDRGS